MDQLDRTIINNLQGGFPIADHPYRQAAKKLGIEESELIQRLECMLEKKQLSRFGPLYNAERLGGGLSLCAMSIPADAFERVSGQVNGFPEVAHNYARDHTFNMWFVLATERAERIEKVLSEIEKTTGYPVYNMPKEREFFIGLKFEV
ncbi:MAG: Lrp/AsnC family transcriptional regulator [Candidatus Sedimenticola sp. (ex Thyasira tokunagai)]